MSNDKSIQIGVFLLSHMLYASCWVQKLRRTFCTNHKTDGPRNRHGSNPGAVTSQKLACQQIRRNLSWTQGRQGSAHNLKFNCFHRYHHIYVDNTAAAAADVRACILLVFARANARLDFDLRQHPTCYLSLCWVSNIVLSAAAAAAAAAAAVCANSCLRFDCLVKKGCLRQTFCRC